MSNKNETITIEINIPKSCLEDKDKALGEIIRRSRNIILQEENIPGKTKYFWDETPVSTVELYTALNMSPQNFSKHFKSFQENHGVQPKMIETEGKWIAPIYFRETARKFIDYLNRNWKKYDIEL